MRRRYLQGSAPVKHSITYNMVVFERAPTISTRIARLNHKVFNHSALIAT
jgi:hypothetical protein